MKPADRERYQRCINVLALSICAGRDFDDRAQETMNEALRLRGALREGGRFAVRAEVRVVMAEVFERLGEIYRDEYVPFIRDGIAGERGEEIANEVAEKMEAGFAGIIRNVLGEIEAKYPVEH
jgi:hypothetical protein